MKSKIKRITALLLTAVLCLCLISCSKAATSDITSTSKTTAPPTTASSTVVSKKEATTNTKEKATTTKKESTTQKVTTTKSRSEKSTVKSSSTTTSKLKNCTVSIECKSLLGNTEKLKPGHEKYVPKDGYILKNYTYTFEKNKTVFDALEYACEKNSIILNSRSSPYGIYVAGINNLDEFDCGPQSGWKYKVNGVDADRGVSYYKLSGGEKIVFYYTLTA